MVPGPVRVADEPARYRSWFTDSGVAQAIISRESVIVAVNAATCALLNRLESEVVGSALFDGIPVEALDADRGLLESVFSGRRRSARFEQRMGRRDGRWLDTLVSVSAIVGLNGAVVEVSVCLQDITELKEAQRDAERALGRWKSLAQNASEVALITDEQLRVQYVSPSLTELLGHAEQELNDLSLLDFVHPRDGKRLQAATERYLADGRGFGMELRIRHADGHWLRVAHRSVNLLGDPAVRGLVHNLRDVTEHRKLQERLRAAVLRDRLRAAVLQDPLTGMPNRALLMDRVQQAFEREIHDGARHALLCVDLDGFRALNDSFGYSVGDQILRATADTLTVLVRPTDTVARYGSDQFAVLLDPCGDDSEVVALAERLATALNVDLGVTCSAGQRTTVHVSAGVGLALGPATDPTALLSAAEAAMHRAKRAGRGRVHVLGTHDRDDLSEQRALAADLTAAVGAQGLAVHYQPIVDLKTGALAGFEALVRWPHPTRGLVPPDLFLPLAHSLDLLVGLDQWVLRQACREASTWPAAPGSPARSVTVAVNVSPSHLTSPGFVAGVEAALAVTRLPASSLVLEVTETAVVTDLRAAEQNLRALAARGVGISIDDFGTGYSSMLQLRELPFDKLKIDREFVRGLPDRVDDIAICASAVSLAGRIGLSCVAEGVETTDQAAVLAGLGCEYGQGFLWSPAVDADEARRLVNGAGWEPSAPSAHLPRLPSNDRHEAADMVDIARGMHASGASLLTIAARLNSSSQLSASGRRWHPATIARMLYAASIPASR